MSDNGTAVATTPTNRMPGVASRKIAIIGKAPSSVFLAPYKDDGWEIWILNTLGHHNEVPRWDRQFELHDLNLTKDKAYGDYYQWLSQQTKPVYLRDAPPADFAGGVQFPLAKIQEHFKDLAGVNYLTNTVSLMLALAAYECDTSEVPVTDIGCWGVDMAQHATAIGGNAGSFQSEYAKQRPSCEYWVGVCDAKARFHLPAQSDLLKAPCVYGYHTTERMTKFNARRNELSQRIGQCEQISEQKKIEAAFLAGAREGMAWHEQTEYFYAEVTK